MEGKFSQFKSNAGNYKGQPEGYIQKPFGGHFQYQFPLTFILVFLGFIGNGGTFSLDVALDKTSDTTNYVYTALRSA